MARSGGLDAVRGAAIGMVLLWHLVEPPLKENYPSFAWILSLSWSGVDLFFVLSGFLIGGILLDHSNGLTTFYARRACRIVPLYVLFLIACGATSTASLWPYITFTQNFSMASSGAFGPSGLGQTWSLAVEEQFYLLLPAVLILSPRERLPQILLLLIFISPPTRFLLRYAYGNHFAPYLLLPGRMDALFLGVLAAWLVRHPQALQWMASNRWKIRAAAGVSFLSLVFLSSLGLLWFGNVIYSVGQSSLNFFYFLLVLLVATAKGTMPLWLRPLSWMGIGAYSLYLFHIPIVDVAREHFPSYPLTISMSALVLLSVLLWHLLEKPFIAFGRSRFHFKPSDHYGSC